MFIISEKETDGDIKISNKSEKIHTHIKIFQVSFKYSRYVIIIVLFNWHSRDCYVYLPSKKLKW